MCNGLFPVEETCFCDEKCAGADGGDTTSPASSFGDPGDKVGIVAAAFGAGAPGYDQRVDRSLDLHDGRGFGKYDTAICLQGSIEAGVCQLNLVTRRIGKDL